MIYTSAGPILIDGITTQAEEVKSWTDEEEELRRSVSGDTAVLNKNKHSPHVNHFTHS